MPDLLTFQDVPLASLLSADLLKKLRAAGRAVSYGDGRLIHARGDDKPGFSLVRSGAVLLAKSMADGDELTIGVLGPGFGFGEATLFGGAARAYHAYAVGETIIDQIPKRAFEKLLDEEPALARAMLASLTRRLYSALDFLDDVRSQPLAVRAAKLIADMNASAKTPGRVECRQSDLAFTLGVSRVSIGKVLAELAGEGLISLGYGEIGVANARALSNWISKRAR